MFLQIAGQIRKLKRSKGVQQAKDELKSLEYTEKRLRELVPKAEEMERFSTSEIPDGKQRIKEIEGQIKGLVSDIEQVGHRDVALLVCGKVMPLLSGGNKGVASSEQVQGDWRIESLLACDGA